MSRGVLCIGARTGAIPELLTEERIVERKSVRQIVRQLERLDIEDLKKECVRNVQAACKYDSKALENKRNAFFDQIIEEFNQR